MRCLGVMKNIILLLVAALLLNSVALAQSKVASSTVQAAPEDKSFISEADEVIIGQTKRAWKEFVNTLNNAEISYSANIPLIDAGGIGLSGGYNQESAPSIGAKYSGVDVWDISANIAPEFFGLDLPINARISASKKMTYIQQFKTRVDSLKRLPYDPITKLPTSAESFLNKEYNKSTNQNEYNIKPGDFIGLRTNLTLAVGRDFFVPEVSSFLKFGANITTYLSGDFDLHIFRMSNDQVRVKIYVVQNKGNIKSVGLGYSLVQFDNITRRVIKHMLGGKIIELLRLKSKRDIHIADYVFNLKSTESRALYDELVGHRLKYFDPNSLYETISKNNPLVDVQEKHKALVADLEKFNRVAVEDKDKALADRKLIRIFAGRNQYESKTSGSFPDFKINVIGMVGLKNGSTRSVSKISVLADDSISKLSNYLLNSQNKNFSYRLFWLWGEEDSAAIKLLTQTAADFKPTDLIGFKYSKSKKDSTLSSKEYDDLKMKMNLLLPAPVAAKLKFPDWKFNGHTIKNANISQEIYFTSNIFKVNEGVSSDKIKAIVIDVLNKYSQVSRGYDADADDIELIGNSLERVFSKNTSIDVKYKEYMELSDKSKIFAKISAAVLLNLTPEKDLEKVVLARLSLSARKAESSVMTYPDEATYQKAAFFLQVISLDTYSQDTSYNLRSYMKEDGTPYMLEEIMPVQNLKSFQD